MSLLSLLGLTPTAAEHARSLGILVHDENSGRWIDLEREGEEPLPCQHDFVYIDDGIMSCERCEESSEVTI